MNTELESQSNKTLLKNRLLFLAVLAALYLALFFLADKLQFPLRWDEKTFWPISQSFSEHLIPSWEQLKSYNSPNTPLPFLIFGWLEYFFRGGIFASRLFDLILSFILLCLIGLPKTEHDRTSPLAAIGLLLCPYYVFVSFHLYTDLIAVFFVVLGFWFYTSHRHLPGGLCFALAIASRQYMLAFPMAVAGFELFQSFQGNFQINRRWIAPTLAAATILVWIWLFGGLVPPKAATTRNLPVQSEVVTSYNSPSQSEAATPYDSSPQQATAPVLRVRWLFPERGIYFLTCVGFYFVLPEFILFRRWRSSHFRFSLKNCLIAFLLTILFCILPSSDSKGVVTKIIEFFPFDLPRMIMLYGLALASCWRFARIDLPFWIILMNFGILMRGFAWDKYVLPVVAVLWFLKSVGALENSENKNPEEENLGNKKTKLTGLRTQISSLLQR